LTSEEGLGEHVVGRRQELAAIDRFFEVLPAGGSALVFAGDAGVGKTTLWEHALVKARSRGLGVAVTRAAAAESSLSFAGLADLLAGVDAELGALPAPQHAAFEQALLRRPAAGPVEVLAVSLAAASVFQALAARVPLLIAIDDVQWLDAATAGVLSFALRRLAEQPIGVVASQRLDEAEPRLDLERTFAGGLRRVVVGSLSVEEIAQVVGMRLGRRVPRAAARAFHAASSGNPYFAVELADAVGADGELSAQGRLVVPGGLRELLTRRLDGLSTDGRRAVVAVAAAGRASRDVIATVSAAGVDEALAADVVRVVDGRLLPRHPLLATIGYEEAAPAERIAVHGLLAEVGAEEERPLHLALATETPNADVSARLEAAAAARGAAYDAGLLAAHAARLTPKEAQAERLRRGLLACDLLEESGDLEQVRSTARALLAGPLSDADAAKVLMRLGSASSDRLEGARLLREALDLAGDDETAAAVHFRLAGALGIAEGFVVWAGHCRAAADLAERGDSALFAMALASACAAEFWLGKGIDHELMARAIALEDSLDDELPFYTSPRMSLAQQLMWTDDFAEARPLLEAQHRRALEHGAEAERTGILFHLVELECRAGNLDRADRYAAELRRLHWELDLQQLGVGQYAQALAAAVRGDVARARSFAREGIEESEAYGDEIFRIQNSWVLGLAELAAGDATAAHQVLAPLPDALDRIGLVEIAFAPALALDAEALALLGRVDEADAIATRLDQRGRALGRTAARAAAARCRMLAAAARGDFEAALGHGRRALAANERVDEPFERARTLLLLGTVRRRAGQKRLARETLAEARHAFEALGATGWAEQAAAEIRRIGGRAAASEGLSEMERRIARLAAEGRTNREIAAAAVVSVKTVEANLTKAYRKLGVRSRTELARLLDRQT
jgi:DNA-binding CsgD family transcriptional regulator